VQEKPIGKTARMDARHDCLLLEPSQYVAAQKKKEMLQSRKTSRRKSESPVYESRSTDTMIWID